MKNLFLVAYLYLFQPQDRKEARIFKFAGIALLTLTVALGLYAFITPE